MNECELASFDSGQGQAGGCLEHVKSTLKFHKIRVVSQADGKLLAS
jgi:hypothetical protein